jgi:hypothetical protein
MRVETSPELTNTTPSLLPTTFLLVVTVRAHASPALPKDKATLSRELRTHRYWRARPGRILLAEQQVLSIVPPIAAQLHRRLRVAHKTAAYVVALVRRTAPVAPRRTASLRVRAPTSAPDHPIVPQRPTLEIYFVPTILPVQVLAPLPDIAVHVEQSPVIRLLLPDRMGFPLGVLSKPSIISKFAPNSPNPPDSLGP